MFVLLSTILEWVSIEENMFEKPGTQILDLKIDIDNLTRKWTSVVNSEHHKSSVKSKRTYLYLAAVISQCTDRLAIERYFKFDSEPRLRSWKNSDTSLNVSHITTITEEAVAHWQAGLKKKLFDINLCVSHPPHRVTLHQQSFASIPIIKMLIRVLTCKESSLYPRGVKLPICINTCTYIWKVTC